MSHKNVTHSFLWVVKRMLPIRIQIDCVSGFALCSSRGLL